MQHDAWHALFFNSFFWEQTGKHGLMLRRVCKEFKDGIPEQYAIESAFKDVVIRKVDIFRLFPLSVHDVVRMRSPLLFRDTFKLALKKTGGFDFCIAVMREKGLASWNAVGVKRANLKSKLHAELRAGGVTWTVSGQLFDAVVSGKRIAESAVVWYYESFIDILPDWGAFRPSPSSPLRVMHKQWEFDTILFSLRDAVGFWYKGIRRDVVEIIGQIDRARNSNALGHTICCMHHQHVAGKKFLFGVIRFRPWNEAGN
jgi:hypothetical protein